MRIFKNILLLLVVLLLSYFTSEQTGDLYEKILKQPGSYIDLRSLIGIPLSYIFFLLLFFTFFGGSKKYWWIGALLIPAAIFEAAFDLRHIYFPIALGLLGWFLGWGIGKLFTKKT